MNRASTQQVLKQLPLRWSIAILLLLVGYWLVQPMVNSRLGWQLPSLASLMGEAEPATKSSHPASNRSKVPVEPTVTEQPAQFEQAGDQQSRADSSSAGAATSGAVANKPGEATSSAQSPHTGEPAQPPASGPVSPGLVTGAEISESRNLLYGLLKETGRQRYVSPAGLQYNPGSEEGHRLKHLERHLQDQPDRPGKHGVFEGDMAQTLKWIDDAYMRGQQGARGVQVRQEDSRTIYEAPFSSPIGYVGGRDGKRTGNPPARRLRLVVEGSRFITAFPF